MRIGHILLALITVDYVQDFSLSLSVSSWHYTEIVPISRFSPLIYHSNYIIYIKVHILMHEYSVHAVPDIQTYLATIESSNPTCQEISSVFSL